MRERGSSTVRGTIALLMETPQEAIEALGQALRVRRSELLLIGDQFTLLGRGGGMTA